MISKEGGKQPGRNASPGLQRTRKKYASQGRILAERLKELNCLYTISKIFDKKGLNLDGVIRRMIQVIPTAWQYPTIAGTRVILKDKDFRTKRFCAGEWMQECPIIVQGVSVGSVAVSYSEKRPEQDEGPFLKEERNLLNVIAQRLGDIIERKWSEQKLLRYQEELRSLATELALSEEQERRRIAQALHDRIGQVLALINIRVGALLESAGSKDLAKALQDIRGLVSESVAEIRSLTFDLSPPILYELGFEAALEWLAERIQQQYGVEVEIRGCEKKIPISTEWRVTLFAAVRELLVNVGKHARSPIARVLIKKRQGNIAVSVEDRGVGMDPSTRASVKPGTDGFGLFSIRERLGFMGGRVEISSKRGQGTCVTLFVPIEKLKRVRDRR
ncbi:MAG: GAF domain-containing sensor histidine kinase [Acidobacteria bacterium]|nr:GAF domain-containing sensor histidine kinase [Acidobacteriota bacterium]